MNQEVFSQSHKAGMPPGTVIHVGRRRTEKTRLNLIDYSTAEFQEKPLDDINETFALREGTITWINVDGLQDPAIIQRIGQRFGLHPLIQEDIVNTQQRPKLEDHEEYLFIVLKMLYRDEIEGETVAEQVSLILGRNYVISFQEGAGDAFGLVRERLRKNKGMLRRQTADSLAYALIDAIVDNYFVVLEDFGEITENLEENLLESPAEGTLSIIKNLKRELLFMRRGIWPLREVISGLRNSDSSLIHDATRIYFQDVYDHTVQAMDSIENAREMLSDLLDIYLSSVSNRMNAVMKVLTIIATIFIPLTFIAGVYGMNFENMPELGWEYGYFLILGFMSAVAIALLIFFRRKKWL
ncbi:MAG: magnesium/cobalt transporter CorA [Dehalogenimonas sp.]|uniref:Magnesium transport protein CorA n=1 Tax=Candidatus Dehalogenimonas loeffleri TaxID=3127115 RepID=A0ABZ2J291_9CHLR|nr:magnesium/cobalt transporter CorA [Dehalogenimonas sp.]